MRRKAPKKAVRVGRKRKRRESESPRSEKKPKQKSRFRSGSKNLQARLGMMEGRSEEHCNEIPEFGLNGKTFASWNALDQELRAYQKEHFVSFRIRDSRLASKNNLEYVNGECMFLISNIMFEFLFISLLFCLVIPIIVVHIVLLSSHRRSSIV